MTTRVVALSEGGAVPFTGCAVPVWLQQTGFLSRAGEVVSNHDELMCNFFAQADALAYGKVRSSGLGTRRSFERPQKGFKEKIMA